MEAALFPEGYLAALAVTLVVEIPVWAFGLRRLAGVPPAHGALAATGANLVTHPLIWVVLDVSPLAGELLAWALESAVAWWLGERDRAAAVGVVLVANGLSLLAGLAAGALA